MQAKVVFDRGAEAVVTTKFLHEGMLMTDADSIAAQVFDGTSSCVVVDPGL